MVNKLLQCDLNKVWAKFIVYFLQQEWQKNLIQSGEGTETEVVVNIVNTTLGKRRTNLGRMQNDKSSKCQTKQEKEQAEGKQATGGERPRAVEHEEIYDERARQRGARHKKKLGAYIYS